MKIYKLTPEYNRVYNELKHIGVDEYALNMVNKGESLNFLISGVSSPAANIIKQESIASGMDAAVKKGVISCSVEKSDILLLGNKANYKRLIKRLSLQAFGLKQIAEELKVLLENEKGKFITHNTGRIELNSTKCMCILNTTPDSFSDGNKYVTEEAIANQIDAMALAGVDIIDIGGMSSRPYSEGISFTEEIKRIKFALDYTKQYDMIVSVDTNNFKTAEYALKNGANIINDISGMEDDNMVAVCKEAGCAICVMHMLGNPKNMQNDIKYNHIIYDIQDFFSQRIEKCVNMGIERSSIILDVGFGFGKTLEQNYILLKYLKEFKIFDLPILTGISRKSMIGSVVNRDVTERLAGTISANTVAILNGADIIRVHDINEGIDTVKIADTIIKANI